MDVTWVKISETGQKQIFFPVSDPVTLFCHIGRKRLTEDRSLNSYNPEFLAFSFSHAYWKHLYSKTYLLCSCCCPLSIPLIGLEPRAIGRVYLLSIQTQEFKIQGVYKALVLEDSRIWWRGKPD